MGYLTIARAIDQLIPDLPNPSSAVLVAIVFVISSSLFSNVRLIFRDLEDFIVKLRLINKGNTDSRLVIREEEDDDEKSNVKKAKNIISRVNSNTKNRSTKVKNCEQNST